MISRERLEELIKQGATIYEVKYGNINSVSLKNKIRYVNYKYKTITFEPRPDEKYLHHKYFKRLFETQEDAEFAKEFKNITRIETLNLPTFEELKKFERFDFKAKDGYRYSIQFISGFNTLAITGIIENKYYGEATKENYLEACKIAKKIFLGDKIDD